jgi:hypothetical protein
MPFYLLHCAGECRAQWAPLLPYVDRYVRRKIRLIEGNVKCRYLKKLTCKGTFRQFYLSEAHSLPRLLFGVVKQFCRYLIRNRVQSVKLLQNMVSNTA